MNTLAECEKLLEELYEVKEDDAIFILEMDTKLAISITSNELLELGVNHIVLECDLLNENIPEPLADCVKNCLTGELQDTVDALLASDYNVSDMLITPGLPTGKVIERIEQWAAQQILIK